MTQLVLQRDQHAPALARRFLVSALCQVHLTEVADEAELLVSELVTNAVLHGTPPVTVRLTCDTGQVLRLEVSDTNPQLPRLRHPDAQEMNGRGMELVDLLSQDWGVCEGKSEKVIWLTLGTTSELTPALTA